MSRESCISHPAGQLMAIVRQDYQLITGGDCAAAALLSLFEYWANAAIAFNCPENCDSIHVGIRKVNDMQAQLLGIAKEKTIREKLKSLESQGFISSKAANDNSKEFWFRVQSVKEAIASTSRSTPPVVATGASGKFTAPPPVNPPDPSGKFTAPPPVNLPFSLYTSISLKEEESSPETRAQTSSFTTPQETPIANPPIQTIAQPIKPESIPLPVQKVLDRDSPVAENPEERISPCEVEVLSEVIVPLDHPISRLEARFGAGMVERPWNKNQGVRGAFIQYLANTRKGKRDTFDQVVGIYTCMVRNADYALPGAKAYDQVLDAWHPFVANAQQAQSVDQLTKKDSLNPRIAALFSRHRKQETSSHAV